MTPHLFEIAIAIGLLLVCCLLLLPPHRLRDGLLAIVVAATLVGASLYAIAGAWQVVPAIVLLIVAALLLCLWRASGFRSIVASWAGRIVFAVAALAALSVFYFVPVWTLPVPSGPYTIGVADGEFFDRTREEPFLLASGQPRRMMVRFWYPAMAGSAQPTRPYRTAEDAALMGRDFARTLRLNPVLFGHLSLIETHAHIDADPASDMQRLPLLVFSHGYLGAADTNTALAEALASRGFIVASITHPYESSGIRYANGEMIRLHPDVMQRFLKPTPDPAIRILIASRDVGERLKATQEIGSRSERLNFSAPIWRDDMVAVANAIEKGAFGHGVAGKVAARADLSRLVYAGMSFGGPAAAAACQIDTRCKASANLDGREVAGDFVDVEARAPLLMLYQSANVTIPGYRYNDFHYEHLATMGQRADVQRYIVAGTGHWDFTDYTLYARQPVADRMLYPGLLGTLHGSHVLRLLDETVYGFFAEQLKLPSAAPFATVTARFPELQRQELTYVRDWAATRTPQ